MAVRATLRNRRSHEVVEFHHGGIRYHAGVGRFPSGAVAEIFLRAGEPGSDASVVAHDAAVIASLALQFGVPLGDIRHALTKLPDGVAAGPIGRLLDILADAV